MRRPLVFRGLAAAVVVERDRLERHPLGAGKGLRVSVVRRAGRVEDDASIEDRQDLLSASCHRAVPQLELPVVTLLPVTVQVEEQVESSVELETMVPAEVRVDFEVAASRDLVQASALEMRIRDEDLDAGQPFQEPNEE